MDKDKTIGDCAWDVGKEGLVGGGTEVTGGLANRALVGTGRVLMRHAAARHAQAAQRSFPTVIDDALKDGARLSNRGLKASEATTTASREAADRLIAEAEAAGAPGLDLIEDVVKPTRASVTGKAEAQAQLGSPGGMDALERKLRATSGKRGRNPAAAGKGPVVRTERAGSAPARGEPPWGKNTGKKDVPRNRQVPP